LARLRGWLAGWLIQMVPKLILETETDQQNDGACQIAFCNRNALINIRENQGPVGWGNERHLDPRMAMSRWLAPFVTLPAPQSLNLSIPLLDPQ
jgi:hypothetical protein